MLVVACQEFGRTVSEKKTEAMYLWSDPSTASNALRIEAAGQRYKQITEFLYLDGVISESADLDTEIKRRIGAAWVNIKIYTVSNSFIDGTPGCHSRSGYSKWRGGKLCCTNVPRGLCALKTLAACVPPTTSYYCASSAFGARIIPGSNLYRMERRWRGPFPNASKRQNGSVTLGSPRPLFGKVTLEAFGAIPRKGKER